MKIKPTKEQLYEMYVVQRLSIPDISKLLSICQTTVFNCLQKYSIPRRSISESLRDKPKSLSHRQKLSESKKGANHPNFGMKCKMHGTRCWYVLPDGRTVSMRSQWEVWYAEYLTENNIKYSYEEFTFNLPNGSAYTPDFYLVESNQFIEVKGWLTATHREKIAAFRTAYSDKELIVADKKYLEALGIDLRKKWIASKPLFPCSHCGLEYHRSYPSQRYCTVICRNRAIACGTTEKIPDKPKRKYNGSQSGESNNCARLSEESVREVRRLYNNGLKCKEIANLKKIAHSTVWNIVHYKSWKHVV